MNRQIMFRAWDTQINKMVNPLKLDFFTNSGCTKNKPSHLEVELTTCDFKGVTDTNTYDDISDRFILMQYTGLNDKNNNPIYEGDIGEVKTQSGRVERFVVEYGIHRRDMASGWTVDIAGFAFMIDGKATFPIANNYQDRHDLEIIRMIGNIYETPELLSTN